MTLRQDGDPAVGTETGRASERQAKEKKSAEPSGMCPPHVFAVCAYRESPYLEECLNSLLAQTEKSRIIVCTSTPSAFLTELCRKYGLPLYVRDGESSLCADWNFAVETAVRETLEQGRNVQEKAGASNAGAMQKEAGQKAAACQKAETIPSVMVTIAHQDDRYHKEYTAELCSAYRKWPDLRLFCTRYRTIDAAGAAAAGIGTAERIKRILRLPLRLQGLCAGTWWKRLPLRLGNSIGCPTCTYVLGKADLPLFRRPYAFVIDWDTLWRLAGEPGRFICREKELMDYRVHSGAATMANIANHNREKEETEMFHRMWPGPIAGFLMHFYKRAYHAYERAD